MGRNSILLVGTSSAATLAIASFLINDRSRIEEYAAETDINFDSIEVPRSAQAERLTSVDDPSILRSETERQELQIVPQGPTQLEELDTLAPQFPRDIPQPTLPKPKQTPDRSGAENTQTSSQSFASEYKRTPDYSSAATTAVADPGAQQLLSKRGTESRDLERRMALPAEGNRAGPIADEASALLKADFHVVPRAANGAKIDDPAFQTEDKGEREANRSSLPNSDHVVEQRQTDSVAPQIEVATHSATGANGDEAAMSRIALASGRADFRRPGKKPDNEVSAAALDRVPLTSEGEIDDRTRKVKRRSFSNGVPPIEAADDHIDPAEFVATIAENSTTTGTTPKIETHLKRLKTKSAHLADDGNRVAAYGAETFNEPPLQVSDGELVSVRLDHLISLFENKMERSLFVWLKTSAAANKYVTPDTLRDAGIEVAFNPRSSQLVLSVAP